MRARALHVPAPFTQHRDYCCLSHAPLLAPDDIVLDGWWFSSAKRNRRGASVPCKSTAMARRYLSTVSGDSDAICGPEPTGDDVCAGRTRMRNSDTPSVSSRADSPEGTRITNSVGEETRETGELCNGVGAIASQRGSHAFRFTSGASSTLPLLPSAGSCDEGSC